MIRARQYVHLERYVDVNIKNESEYDFRARIVAASPISKEIISSEDWIVAAWQKALAVWVRLQFSGEELADQSDLINASSINFSLIITRPRLLSPFASLSSSLSLDSS